MKKKQPARYDYKCQQTQIIYAQLIFSIFHFFSPSPKNSLPFVRAQNSGKKYQFLRHVF